MPGEIRETLGSASEGACWRLSEPRDVDEQKPIWALEAKALTSEAVLFWILWVCEKGYLTVLLFR